MYGTLRKIPINVSSAGSTVLVLGVAGKRTSVYKVWYVVAADVNAKFLDGAVDFHPAITIKANGSFVLDYDKEPWFSAAPGNNFSINLSGAVQVGGILYYTQA